jgi:hypothetical protein
MSPDTGGFAFGGRGAETGRVSPVVELVLAMALLPASGYALIGGWRAAGWVAEKRRKALAPAPVPADRLAADLRRLRAKLEDTETRTDLFAKHHRVQAVRGAYLDALTTACRRLNVAPPPAGRAPLAEIYRVEAALRQRGLDVRETAYSEPPASSGSGACGSTRLK